MGRLVWFMSLALLAALTISVQLDRQSAIAPHFADLTPEPVRSFAQAQIAARALAGEDPQEALQETRKLVARRPLPAEPLRMLAQAQIQSGQSSEGLTTIQIAAQRGWRDPAAQEAMLRVAIAAGDEREAARRYVALLVRRGTSDDLLQEFGEILFSNSHGLATQTLAGIVASSDRWRPVFLRRGMRVLPATSIAGVIAQSAEAGAAFDCALLRQTVQALERMDKQAHPELHEVVRIQC
ncbi:tetratricopeptide repeat protein [Erythrobacter rubeus]|nr:hypothetical protein [Erythrobacter rubeus]